MQDHATVFQAELEAMHQVCIFMKNSYTKLTPNFVKILTDSQAALKALDIIEFKSRNQPTLQALQ